MNANDDKDGGTMRRLRNKPMKEPQRSLYGAAFGLVLGVLCVGVRFLLERDLTLTMVITTLVTCTFNGAAVRALQPVLAPWEFREDGTPKEDGAHDQPRG